MLGEKHETYRYRGLEIRILIIPIPDLKYSIYSFLSYSNGLEIGHCYLEYRHQTKKASIEDFYIEEPYRRKGGGSIFWEFVEKYILRSCKPREFYGGISDVDDFNQASSFWRKMGFKVVDHRPSPKRIFVGKISKRIS